MDPRCRPLIAACAAAFLTLPAAAAHAHVAHTVSPGETLWQLAAQNNMTTRAFAAANGMSEDARIIAGTTISIPSVPEAAAALASAPAAAAPTASGSAAPAATPAASPGAPAPMGGYTVRPGDTLSGLAATSRVSLEQMAQMNGLDPAAPLLAGTVIKLPTGAPTPANAAKPAPARRVVAAAPAAAPGRVSAGDVHSVAAEHGVPGSLAAAIGWQESGFNNAMVSSANARGVMQVMPGTWDWIQDNLAKRELDPDSATDNVHAGVLYLRSLLNSTGGDPATAAAAYYQGLSSVQRIGMLPETRRYVDNVLALRSRFGG
jgi:soluble lytic murein transglycosylase-like protein